MALSLAKVENVALKPCDVISSPVYPMRRKAAFKVFSLIGRWNERVDGKSKRPWPVSSFNSNNNSIERFGNGTACSARIFIRSAGILQTLASKSNSVHSAKRNSLGRVATIASNYKPKRVVLSALDSQRSRASDRLALSYRRLPRVIWSFDGSAHHAKQRSNRSRPSRLQ